MAPGAVNPPARDQEDSGAEPALNRDDPKFELRSVSSVMESSNAGSFYNATRATSNNDGTTDHITTDALQPADSRMAVHVAAFLSASQTQALASSGPAESPPRRSADQIDRPPPARLMADKLRFASNGEVTGWSMPDHLSEFHEASQSSSADDSSKGKGVVASLSSKFPDNVKSPVSPTMPVIPPPVRKPTPPGCPTFGSEEARSFFRRVESPPVTPTRSDSLLRRLFRNASPTRSPPSENRQPRNRLYAADGTAVMGSFPQRQSGHGTNVLKGTDEHPYHQRNLPFAQTDGPSTDANNNVGPELPGPSKIASASSETGSDEATLRWLEGGGDPSTSAAPAPTPAPSPNNPVRRPDSYQTARSQIPASTAPWRILQQGLSVFEACSPLQTQSAVQTNTQDTTTAQRENQQEKAPVWETFLERTRSTLCCCCYRGRLSQDSSAASPINPNATNTTTQDTYVTARDHVSNESQQHSPTDATASHPGS